MEPLKITEKTNEQLLKDILPDTNELILRLKLLVVIYKIKRQENKKLLKYIKGKIKQYNSVIYDLKFSLIVEKDTPNDLKLRRLLKLSIEELEQNTTADFKELKTMFPELTEGHWYSIKREFSINE